MAAQNSTGIGHRVLVSLRDAPWATSKRMRAYGFMAFAIILIFNARTIMHSSGGVDETGILLGTDFLCYWAASKLTLGGHAADAYNFAVHRQAELAVFPALEGILPFIYPPVFLLIILPLALLPYLASLTVWLVVTAGAAYAGLRAYGRPVGVPFWLVFAFPAFTLALGSGQNALLTVAIFAFGLALMDRRPLLAGILLGLLIYKPQYGVLFPLALAASGRWRVFFGAALGAAGALGLSWLVFGTQVWSAFLASTHMAEAMLNRQSSLSKQANLYLAVRVLGGPLWAYGVQALLSGLSVAALVVAARRKADAHAFGALIVTAAMLCNPHLVDYDLMLLAIPLVYAWSRGVMQGFLPWEKIGLLIVFIMPLAGPLWFSLVPLPLAPFVLLGLMALLLKRIGHEMHQSRAADGNTLAAAL